jgi:hypothetical protein
LVKAGKVEKTSDREYEVEERRYRTLESASLRLQKEAKGYLDSLRAMTASQMRIAETIDAFYGDSGARDGVSRSYKQAVEDLDAETVKALDGPYRCVDFSLQAGILSRQVYCVGGDAVSIIHGIEKELNFVAGKSRVYTRDHPAKHMRRLLVLTGGFYRTTVLEPINRFCAYFPDINECEHIEARGPMIKRLNEMQVLRSGITRCSTMIQCEAKSRGWSRSRTRTLPSCRERRRRPTW